VKRTAQMVEESKSLQAPKKPRGRGKDKKKRKVNENSLKAIARAGG
jgi:hypothetical protein